MENKLDTLELQPLPAGQMQHITGGNIDIDLFNHRLLIHIETDVNFYLHI